MVRAGMSCLDRYSTKALKKLRIDKSKMSDFAYDQFAKRSDYERSLRKIGHYEIDHFKNNLLR